MPLPLIRSPTGVLVPLPVPIIVVRLLGTPVPTLRPPVGKLNRCSLEPGREFDDAIGESIKPAFWKDFARLCISDRMAAVMSHMTVRIVDTRELVWGNTGINDG